MQEPKFIRNLPADDLIPSGLVSDAREQYAEWIQGKAGLAWAGDEDIMDAFIEGYVIRALTTE